MRYFLSVVMIFATFSIVAQDNKGLNRQVEVTKVYTPEVDGAAKLSVRPRMDDTVLLRPDINYKINPTAWSGVFNVSPISVATVDARTYDKQNPFYLKAGMGAPLMSVLDFYGYYSGKKASIGGYVNHYGSYSKLTNDAGNRLPAKYSPNKVGVYGSGDFGRMKLGAEIGFDYIYADLYGDKQGITISDYDQTRRYLSPRMSIFFGNDFTDISRFNFRVGENSYMFFDKNNNREDGINLFVDMLAPISDNRNFSINAGYDWHGIGESYYDALTLRPVYNLNNKRFKMSIGLFWTNSFEADDNWFCPVFKMDWDITNGFAPFVDINPYIRNNSYRNLSALNPYIVPSMVSHTGYISAIAGFKGVINKNVAYKLFGGFELFDDISFVAISSTFIPSRNEDIMVSTFGADIDIEVNSNSNIIFKIKTDIDIDENVSIPDYKVSLDLSYKHKNKFSVNAGCLFSGTRYEQTLIINDPLTEVISNELPSTADLYVDFDYNLSRKLGIFVSARNLLNEKLYPFNNYRGLGINVMAGIKLAF